MGRLGDGGPERARARLWGRRTCALLRLAFGLIIDNNTSSVNIFFGKMSHNANFSYDRMFLGEELRFLRDYFIFLQIFERSASDFPRPKHPKSGLKNYYFSRLMSQVWDVRRGDFFTD